MRKENDSHSLEKSLLHSMLKSSQKDFSHYRFEQIDFSDLNLSAINFTNVLFVDCKFVEANLSNCLFIGADLRNCDLRYALLNGANFYRSRLEGARLENVRFDKNTQFFAYHCPKNGAFIAYKKCFDERIVQLLIPEEAQRSSATDSTCRCDFAKVLTIKSVDFTQKYEEAISYVDQNFVYKVGKIATSKNFNKDRWADSTGGIHFFMNREEAINYM